MKKKRGAFFHLKFLEKVALVGCNAFGTFGAENLKEHLKIHPALYILIKSQIIHALDAVSVHARRKYKAERRPFLSTEL